MDAAELTHPEYIDNKGQLHVLKASHGNALFQRCDMCSLTYDDDGCSAIGDSCIAVKGGYYTLATHDAMRDYLKAIREKHPNIAFEKEDEDEDDVNAIQHGGTHYKTRAIQPWDYIAANGLDFFQGNIVKYVTRFRDKNGVQDLEKAKHFLDKLIQLET